MSGPFALDGRTALVSGASRGIGRAVALAYAEAGADLALLARDAERLSEVAAEVEKHGRRAVVLPCDVLDPDAVAPAVARAQQELGRIDVLVNNAGGNRFSSPLVTMRFDGWEKVFRLNVDAVVRVTQAVLPGMVERRSGSVVNMASFAGLTGVPLMSHYAAAKAAVVSLTKSLALETAYAGVRVNALAPGWVRTDLTDFLRASDDVESAVIGQVPMGRWATAEEIALPAVFLASDASSFVTGQTLVVDGGLSVRP